MKGFLGSDLSGASLTHKVHADVVAELDTEAERSDQVHHEDRVHLDRVGTEDFVEHPHGAEELEEHQEDAEADDHGDTQTAQDLKGEDHCSDSEHSILSKDTTNVGILVVEDIEERVGESAGGHCLTGSEK